MFAQFSIGVGKAWIPLNWRWKATLAVHISCWLLNEVASLRNSNNISFLLNKKELVLCDGICMWKVPLKSGVCILICFHRLYEWHSHNGLWDTRTNIKGCIEVSSNTYVVLGETLVINTSYLTLNYPASHQQRPHHQTAILKLFRPGVTSGQYTIAKISGYHTLRNYVLTFELYCIDLYWKASFKRDKMEAVDKILAGKYPAKQHAKRVCTGS